MATPDDHKNFAYSTVATAPSPASSGTSLVVASGEGANFPSTSFNATVWPAGAQPTSANAEIVRVTNIATDTFTITRTQEGSSARTIVVGDQIAATITDKSLTDIETLTVGGDLTGTLPNPTVANDKITYAKMQNISATDRLLGRDTAGAGDTEELTVGGGVEFTGSGGIQRSALTGDVTASAGSDSTTIANDAVSNAKAANMAEATIKGRAAGAGTGDPTDLTAAQALAIIAGELGVAQGDIIIATSTTAFDNLAPGPTAGRPLVADPHATNKISFNYAHDLPRTPGNCTVSTAIMSSVDRANATSANGSVLTSGQLIGVAVQLPKGLLITSISFWSATTAAGTPTNQWFGIFDSSGAKLRLTGDDTSTAWAANTKKTLSLSSTYTTTYAGLFYIGIMVKASTVPTLEIVGGSFAGSLIRTGGGGQFLSARDGTHTGLTDPASCPDPWTPTNSVGCPYIELY